MKKSSHSQMGYLAVYQRAGTSSVDSDAGESPMPKQLNALCLGTMLALTPDSASSAPSIDHCSGQGHNREVTSCRQRWVQHADM